MKEYRRIIHIDMDAFFVSVEQRDNPKLKGKPVVVAGIHRGVVAAASYEARKFGVKSAMPSYQALKLCPKLIFVKGNYAAYKTASEAVMKILRSYSELVEQVSIDEAYIDVTAFKPDKMTAKAIAIEIRNKIRTEVGITASAGISFTKFLAKVASDCNKPDGYYIIHPNKAEKFVEKLAIERIPGVGKVNKERLNRSGIYVGGDIVARGKAPMALEFGRVGVYLYNQVTFAHDSPVMAKRLRKSVGKERTFGANIDEVEAMLSELHTIADNLGALLDKKKLGGRTLTLKIKYHNFVKTTRSKTLDDYISSSPEIYAVVCELLRMPSYPEEAVRLLGIQISNLDNARQENRQLLLDL